MIAGTVVQTQIDQATEAEASAVLATMGLTVSDAMRMLLTRIAREKALPFDPMVPNETTVAAMREARAGGLKRAHGVEALMDALRADD